MLDEFALGLHGLAEALEQVDLEALQLVVGLDEVEGRIRALDGDPDDRLRRGRLCLRQAWAHAQPEQQPGGNRQSSSNTRYVHGSPAQWSGSISLENTAQSNDSLSQYLRGEVKKGGSAAR